MRGGEAAAVHELRHAEPAPRIAAADRRSRPPHPDARGADGARPGSRAHRDRRAPLRVPGLRCGARRRAARRGTRVPLLALGDRSGARAMGARARERGVGARPNERGEKDRRGVHDAVGVAAAMDALCAGALRDRATGDRHDPRSRRTRRELRRGPRADRDGLGTDRRLLRSRVLPAKLSDADESPSTSAIDSTRAGSSTPIARGEIDPLRVAPHRDEKETGWISSRRTARGWRRRTRPRA